MNELNLEVGILKSELHKKTREMQALEAHVQQQRVSLDKASDKLKDTKRAAASKIHDKESKREALQKELLKAQSQYSVCYDELLHREKLLHKLKEENIQLTERIMQQSQDVSKMSEERKRLELKLAVVTERHKTVQHEVNNRDQIILQLKTDLKTSQEKYFGSQEELSLQEEEVSRLQQKIKSLQTEARELWEKSSEQEDRLNQVEKSKQQLFHEQEIHLGQIQNYVMIVEKLQKDLDHAKHSHTTDLERWNQNLSLIQKELISETSAHQADLLKIQEYKDKILALEQNLESADLTYQEAQHKIQSQEETIKIKDLDMEQLQQQIRTLEQNIVDSCTHAKTSKSALELCKKKYRACIDSIKSLEKHVDCLQEQIKECTGEIANKKETIQSLKAETSILQRQNKEKSDQVDSFEHLIHQLTEELHSSKDDVKLNKEKCQQHEQLVEILKKKVNHLQQEALENLSSINTMRSKAEEYKSTYRHSNEEYSAQTLQLQKHQEEMEVLRRQCNEKSAKIEEYHRVIEQQNIEARKMLDQQKKYVLETEELEKTLQSLHLEIVSSQQKHKGELVRLDQHVAHLEADLTEARRICAQKDQAISKRDDLLRKSEANLLQAREGIKEKATEAEHLDSMVKKLEERIQEAQKKMNQKEKENNVLRAEMKDLGVELQDVHKLYRETAQELASQEEKLLLLESSLKATQEQLSEQIAETVRQEQNNRKYQTDLKTLKERVTASEEEKSEYKGMLENVKTELTTLKAQHQLSLQESLQLQQTNHKYEIEMAAVRENAWNLQQQATTYEDLVKGLREELNRGQQRQQEEQKHVEKLKKAAADRDCELEQLRSIKKCDAQTIKEQENRLIKQEDEIRQIQRKNSSAQSDLLEAQAQMKILLLNLSTTEKQMKHYTTQAEFYEAAIATLQDDLEQSKKQCKKSTKSLRSAEQNICDLKMEITLLQTNHRQTVEQLNEKTKESCAMHSELKNLRQQLKQPNADVKNLQHTNPSTTQEIHTQEETVLEVTDKLSQTIDDAGNREQKMTVLSDHSELTEKLKLSFFEVANLQNELKTSENKYISTQRELEILFQALEATQTDNSRLHKESEFVAANVNQWIKEQKLANENLSEKIHEQNQLLAHLATERDNFQKREDALSAVVNRLKAELEVLKSEKEQLKENCVEQQALLSKLGRQLKTSETPWKGFQGLHGQEQTSLLEKNLAATEDMHDKLKTNIRSIHFLNQKLNELSQENGCLRQQLEDEKLRCQQSELHLQACNQTLSNFFAHVKGKEEGDFLWQESPPKTVLSVNHKNLPYQNPGPHKPLENLFQKKETKLSERDMGQVVIQDSEDKKFWIQCVEELSGQLQENTEYWTEKMNGLTNQIQKYIATPRK